MIQETYYVTKHHERNIALLKNKYNFSHSGKTLGKCQKATCDVNLKTFVYLYTLHFI